MDSPPGAEKELRGSTPDWNPISEMYGIALVTMIILLFGVVLLTLLLRIYARLCRRRSVGRSPRRREGFSGGRRFSFADEDPFHLRRVGLDRTVIENLPTFVYKSEDFRDGSLECAVCLCEFEENEKARLLPECYHSFHVECIDMWFHSHSTCPLCRSIVYPDSRSNTVESRFVQPISGDSSLTEESVSSNHSITIEIHTNLVRQDVDKGQTSALDEKV